MKRTVCLILAVALCSLCLASCGAAFSSPSAGWTAACNNLIMRSGDGVFAGDVESLQRASEQFAKDYEAMEAQAPQQVDAFIHDVLQIGDMLAEQGAESFFDLPQQEQKAILSAWYILANANGAASEQAYFDALSANAGAWLDPWIGGSSGYVLPIAKPMK